MKVMIRTLKLNMIVKLYVACDEFVGDSVVFSTTCKCFRESFCCFQYYMSMFLGRVYVVFGITCECL